MLQDASWSSFAILIITITSIHHDGHHRSSCWGGLLVPGGYSTSLLGPLFIMIVMCYVYASPYSFMNCGKRMTVVMPHCYNYHKNSSDSSKSLSLLSVLYFLKCCNLRSQLESGIWES